VAARRVLGLVLQHELHHLPEARLVAEADEGNLGVLPTEAVVAQEGPQDLDRLGDGDADVERRSREGRQPFPLDRDEDRVHQPVEPGDLVDRCVAPVVRARPGGRVADAPGGVGEEVDVGADDGERRPQLVGHEREQLGTGLVEVLELLELALLLDLQAALLDDPGQERRDRDEEVDLARREPPGGDGLDVEDADDQVVPGERHRQHRREACQVEAAEVLEARVEAHVGNLDRAQRRGRRTGDPSPWPG